MKIIKHFIETMNSAVDFAEFLMKLEICHVNECSHNKFRVLDRLISYYYDDEAAEHISSDRQLCELIISGCAHCFSVSLDDVWSFYNSDDYHGMSSMVEWCRSFHKKSGLKGCSGKEEKK